MFSARNHFMTGRRRVSYVGGASAEATTVTLPTHQTGDMIVIFAFRTGSATPPTLPAGYTNIVNGGHSGGAAASVQVGYKIAASGSETSGTWTNAEHLHAVVYRGAASIGASAQTGAATAIITYPALTLTNSSGNSWVVTGAIHRVASATLSCPTTTSRNTIASTRSSLTADTAAGVSSWSAQTFDTGSAAAWNSASIEIYP